MGLKQELKIHRAMSSDVELMLALLYTRERIVKLMDSNVFTPFGITEPQFNALRILRGGPAEGYSIREIKARMITRNADVPRLVDRLVSQGWVLRESHPADARSCRVLITAEGLALVSNVSSRLNAWSSKIAKALDAPDRERLLVLLDQVRRRVAELEPS